MFLILHYCLYPAAGNDIFSIILDARMFYVLLNESHESKGEMSCRLTVFMRLIDLRQQHVLFLLIFHLLVVKEVSAIHRKINNHVISTSMSSYTAFYYIHIV